MTPIEIINAATATHGILHQHTEMNACLEFLQNKNLKGFIEIGCANGASFYCWASVIPNGPKVSIDLNHGFDLSGGLPGANTIDDVPAATEELYDTVRSRNDKWRANFSDVRIVEGNSMAQETIEKTRQILNGELVDWIFIDAWHEKFAVELDLKNYSQFLSAFGYIAFHDIHQSPSMEQFWSYIQSTYADTIEISGGTGIGIIPQTSLSNTRIL